MGWLEGCLYVYFYHPCVGWGWELPDSVSTAWSYCWEQVHVWKWKPKGTDKLRASYEAMLRDTKDKRPRPFLSGPSGAAIRAGGFLESSPCREGLTQVGAKLLWNLYEMICCYTRLSPWCFWVMMPKFFGKKLELDIWVEFDDWHIY